MKPSKTALNRIALCALFFLSALPIAQAAEPIAIAMTADRWETKENAESWIHSPEGEDTIRDIRTGRD